MDVLRWNVNAVNNFVIIVEELAAHMGLVAILEQKVGEVEY